MSEQPRRKVRVVLDLEVTGEAARDQLTAERAAWFVVSLDTKEWRYRDRRTGPMPFWDETMDISWRLLAWNVLREEDGDHGSRNV